jgi:hypothetical protein
MLAGQTLAQKVKESQKFHFLGGNVLLLRRKMKKKTYCQAILKVSAGHFWPMGPGLATPDLITCYIDK